MPGAGKTTLAARLGRELRVPVVSRDAIKEAMAAVPVRLPTSRLGAVASEAMWRLVGMIDAPAIVEAFWLTGRDETHFETGLRDGAVVRAIEVWCEVPFAVARRRFLERPRHHAHHDKERGIEEWEGFARAARPISRFPVIRVDTSSAVDMPALAAQIRQRLPALGL